MCYQAVFLLFWCFVAYSAKSEHRYKYQPSRGILFSVKGIPAEQCHLLNFPFETVGSYNPISLLHASLNYIDGRLFSISICETLHRKPLLVSGLPSIKEVQHQNKRWLYFYRVLKALIAVKYAQRPSLVGIPLCILLNLQVIKPLIISNKIGWW